MFIQTDLWSAARKAPELAQHPTRAIVVHAHYFIGLERSHERHRHVAGGDQVIAVSDSDATGTTKVMLPGCGCRAVLIRR
jgi:hypothetical protein